MDNTAVETAALQASEQQAAAAAAAQPQPRPSRWRKLKVLVSPLFLFAVALPTLFAAIYYGLVASDVYVSESRFVVRSPQRPQMTGLGALLSGTGFSRSQDDTYSVHDYVLSRDALTELDKAVGIRKLFSADGIDPIGRFGALHWDKSFEAFYRYYQRHVTIDYDSVSAISVLTVRAYTAADAQKINQLLLGMGERLVNQLNDRSRSDLIAAAQKEVTAAEERAKGASLALSGFRGDRSVFDPDRQAAIALQGVAKMQEELLAAESQLAQLRQVSPNNPQVAVLQGRVNLLRDAVANQRASVTGRGSSSLSSQSSGYDRLALEKQFADRQLATALASLEQAKNEAQRQQLYLERLVQPNLPDTAIEPRRARTVAMVFLVGLIVWGLLSLVVSSVREHTD